MDEKFGLRTKKYMLKELKGKLEKSPNFVVSSFTGIASIEIEKLRKNLLKSESRYFVVKNSIAKKALEEFGIQGLDDFFKGEVGIGFLGDIIPASKTLADFQKEYNKFKVAGAFIDGKAEVAGRIKELASIPSREALLSMLLTYMKSPITGFVGVLNGLLRNLVHVIDEIKSKKEKGEQK